MMKPPRIAAVEMVGPASLRITWTTGECLDVDLSEPIKSLKALAPLRDPAFFARVAVGEWGHSLVWSDEIDLGAARGRYRLAGKDTTEHYTLAIATAVAPSAVVCLLSALQFHRIGTQAPPDVWLAVERGMGRPRLDYAPLRVVYFSGLAFTSGIERHSIEGQEVQVYSVAKTIADCFKYRNKIGLDVALEALTDAWRQRRLSLPDLNAYAEIDRVQRVIHPYVEAVIQ